MYDNFIVAYDIASNQDKALIFRTIQKAKTKVADGLILHSDQEFQNTCTGYWNLSQQYDFAFYVIDEDIHFYKFERIQMKSGHTPYEIRSMPV